VNITVGFIAIFISIVIPGLLFLRFYYFGEFSKQFTTKEPIGRSLLYSIIPGIAIQFFCLLIYAGIINKNLKVSTVLNVHRDLLGEGQMNPETTTFLDNHLLDFGIYSLIVLCVSILLGIVVSRFILITGWDRRSKLFRYKNQWYYIFKGHMFGFKKFKQAVNVLNRPNLKSKNVDMVFADVLINASGKTRLYTGFVVDYDLDSNDPTKLEKIYLFDAHRYKSIEVEDEKKPGEKKTIVEKKPIPGSVFILPVQDMVNINLLYVISEKKKAELLQLKSKKKLFFISAFLLIVIFLISMSYYLYSNASWINFNLYEQYHSKTNWFDKTIAFLLYFQILGFFMPKKDKTDENKIKFFYDMKSQIIAFIVLLILFCSMNFQWLSSLIF